MQIDFNSFADNVNVDKFSSTIVARPMFYRKKGVLGNRGYPSPIIGKSQNSDDFVFTGDNSDGTIYDVEDIIAPALGFKADWKSTSSFTLVNFLFGPRNWIDYD